MTVIAARRALVCSRRAAATSEKGRAVFGAALEKWPAIDAPRRQAALAVYDGIAGELERIRGLLKKNYEGDERKVWMPLDLALRPDECDSQEELDAVVARALARPFTRGNAIFPTNGSRFQLEVVRSLHQARDYPCCGSTTTPPTRVRAELRAARTGSH